MGCKKLLTVSCKKVLTVQCKKVLTVPCKKLLTMWLQNHLTTHKSLVKVIASEPCSEPPMLLGAQLC